MLLISVEYVLLSKTKGQMAACVLAVCLTRSCRMQTLRQSPKVGPGTAFSTFVAPAGDMTLAVLPRWNIVAVARHPVVLSVADASTIPEILLTTGSKVCFRLRLLHCTLCWQDSGTQPPVGHAERLVVVCTPLAGPSERPRKGGKTAVTSMTTQVVYLWSTCRRLQQVDSPELALAYVSQSYSCARASHQGPCRLHTAVTSMAQLCSSLHQCRRYICAVQSASRCAHRVRAAGSECSIFVVHQQR